MRTLRPLILIIALLIVRANLYSQSWQLVWSDEFTNGISGDWVFETGAGGWGNSELQYYRRENASVSNGQLVISAKRESFGGANYTSVRMKTQGKKSWKYGKIEARIAMPSFQGVWPAFWMLGDNISSVGWPKCGEIDIMEHVNTGGEVRGTIHWADVNGNHAEYGGATSTNITAFHTYSVEWDASLIKYFVDGVQYHQVSIQNSVNSTEEFHNNFFILLNMAIGGNWPGWSIDNNAFPANMYVDYVRVYQPGTTNNNNNNNNVGTGVTTLGGNYYLQNRYSGLYMDVTGVSSADGARMQQWYYNGQTNQQFNFIHLGNGVYEILARNSGKSLDVKDVSTADGAPIQQWGYGGGSNQQFVAVSTGDGYYKLIARNSNKAVEVGGYSTAGGGVIQQWSDVGQQTAHWKLVPVVASTTIQAENYTAMSGVQLEGCTDAGGGSDVGYIDANDWMAYSNVYFPSSGNYTIEYRVASMYGGGSLSSDLNAGSIVLGTVGVPSTGGWQNWTTVSQTVYVNAGTYNFGIFAKAGGWNLNWIRITKQGAKMSSADLTTSDTFESGFEFYPNPADHTLYLKSWENFEGASAKIINSLGIEVGTITIDSEMIDISTLEKGIYTIMISQDGNKIAKRFVKQ